MSGGERMKRAMNGTRMTVIIAADNYTYLKTMATVNGVPMANYLNTIIADERLRCPEMYEQAKRELADSKED